MKNDEFLEQIYEDVKALGLIENQWDFSLMCGRTGAWFSCIKARDLPLTADAALTLSLNIKSRIEGSGYESKQAVAEKLSKQLIERVQMRIRKRQQFQDS
jgi:hypothetical protein